jgi:hypothetical protein
LSPAIFAPRIRVTVQVHDGKHQHAAIFHGVNDAVGKTLRAAAADFRVQRLPGFRLLDDALEGGAHLGEKVMSQTGNLLLIITRCKMQFADGRRQQAKWDMAVQG